MPRKIRNLWKWLNTIPVVFLVLIEDRLMSGVAKFVICIPSFMGMAAMTYKLVLNPTLL